MGELNSEHIPIPCYEKLKPLTDGSSDHWCDKCAHRIPDLTDATLAEVEKIREVQGGKVCGIIRVKRAALTGAAAAGFALASCQQPTIQGGIQPYQNVSPTMQNEQSDTDEVLRLGAIQAPTEIDEGDSQAILRGRISRLESFHANSE